MAYGNYPKGKNFRTYESQWLSRKEHPEGSPKEREVGLPWFTEQKASPHC